MATNHSFRRDASNAPTRRLLCAALVAASAASAPKALALVNLNDGRTRIMVSSNVTAGWDSNLFANAAGGGDAVYSVDVSTELVRRGGMIGFDGSVGVNATSYGKYTGENFRNPRFSGTFIKESGGRLTGMLALTASRESRADSAANIRNESWNYGVSSNLSYPVVGGLYSLGGSFGYSRRDFADNTLVVDIDSFHAGIDLYYALSDSRSLITGYRYKQENTSSLDRNSDHSFTLGLNGRILGRINGQIRGGYVIRQSSTGDAFNSWTVSAASSHAFSKRFDINATIAKDFTTTSTNVSVDAISASLTANFRQTARTSYALGTSLQQSSFLGASGNDRTDSGIGWNFSYNRIFSRYLRIRFDYSSNYNWSTESVSDFHRESMSITASTQL